MYVGIGAKIWPASKVAAGSAEVDNSGRLLAVTQALPSPADLLGPILPIVIPLISYPCPSLQSRLLTALTSAVT